jgi:release factor glutamine methyltransferase
MKNKLTVGEYLKTVPTKLRQCAVQNPTLDSYILLEQVLKKDRAFILAHPEIELKETEQNKLSTLLERRCLHEPMAYITGKKEFYGRDFIVNKSVLVPRPESEDFIDLLKSFLPTTKQKLLDVGCGSGILAITAKLEFPDLLVEACDISKQALAVAKENCESLEATVELYKSDLIDSKRGPFDYIFANLPYLPSDFRVEKDLLFEPNQALYSDDGGLAEIRRLGKSVASSLQPEGLVFIESMQIQHKSLMEFYESCGFSLITVNGLVQVYRKSS